MNTLTMSFAVGVLTYMPLVGIETPIEQYNTDYNSYECVSYSGLNLGTEQITELNATTNISNIDVALDFVSSLVKKSQSLDSKISDFVNENFWDLV